jgi:hypothetical protein
MHDLALKMLLGDRAKYIMLISGLSFVSLLMTQQASIFCGIMHWTGSTLHNIPAPIWVVDPMVEQVNDTDSLRDTDVNRVRSVDGVAWAAPLYSGTLRARLAEGANRAAEARYEQALAAYSGAVLTAFREVEDALADTRELAAQLDATQRALSGARDTVARASARYTRGLSNYLDVVDAPRGMLQAERQETQLRADRVLASIQLVSARRRLAEARRHCVEMNHRGSSTTNPPGKVERPWPRAALTSADTFA